jgi:phage-related minor tail protein
MWLFGYVKKEESINTEKEVQDINNTVLTLEKKETLLTRQINEELKNAKIHRANKNEKAAIKCLKKKMRLEKQLLNTEALRNNTETMSAKLEESVLQNESLQSQKRGANALKKMFKKT